MEKATAVARSWLSTCLSEHESCSKRARLSTIWSSDNMHIVNNLEKDDMMPRRLLQWTTTTDHALDPATTRVSVVDLGKTTSETPYLALSHRWGKDETCRLVTSNLAQWKAGKELSALPRLYQDVIKFTHALGHNQLWIDSLCIIQDDSEDWKNEARRMAVVYGHCVATIAAEDSEDSSAGLLDDAHRHGELDKRGWVVQERMISPRTFLCGRAGVRWECRMGDADQHAQEIKSREYAYIPAEDRKKVGKITFLEPEDPENHDPHNPPVYVHKDEDRLDADAPELGELQKQLREYEIPDHPKAMFTFFRDFRLTTDPFSGLDTGDYAKGNGGMMVINTDLEAEHDDYIPWLKVWWNFISMYSQRELTYGKDKFLAMNGVTGVAQRHTQLKCAFGLWTHFLEYELAWFIDPQGPSGQPPRKFRGPSYSWMSIDKGRVVNDVYRRGTGKGRLMIKPVIGIPVGTSFDQELPIRAWTEGGPKYWALEMSGDLRPATIHATRGADGRKQFRVKVNPVGRFSEHEIHEFRPDHTDMMPVASTAEVFCMHFWHYDKDVTGWDTYVDVHLILQQALVTKKLHFQKEAVPKEQMNEERSMRRIGYMETTYTERRDGNAIYEDQWWKYVRFM